ncbi:hypothetical protein OD350_26180 [Clostridium beijerinckii]|uniref:hypothetical protein n=1 Tax=Clostridium beijerinckii TaxID=1520 RepID=UPI0014946C69|nr:hypothetical protein [Clostridium beijerinckii]NOW07455.1 hypothetical protein [Clostridium beijerinckii]NYC04772.1 hypothetical protein [Clostridium beijerinckii]UYZ35632.1 hypothetical protein OD350_26180 [Clostridium beijerinckii]
MLWKYILKIRLNNEIVYMRDINKNENCLSNKDKNLLDKNTMDCEILTNMEVSKHARKC